MQAINSNIICTSITLANGPMVDCQLNPNHAAQSLNNCYTPIPLVTCINMHHFPWEPPKAPQQHFENETKKSDANIQLETTQPSSFT